MTVTQNAITALQSVRVYARNAITDFEDLDPFNERSFTQSYAVAMEEIARLCNTLEAHTCTR